MDEAFSLVIIAMLVGVGGFSVFTAIKLKVVGYLFPSKVLYPGNCNPSECTDEVGFMTYIFPRLLIFGVLCLLFGAALAVNQYAGLGIPEWIGLYAIPTAGVLAFVWYMVVQNKASKLFW